MNAHLEANGLQSPNRTYAFSSNPMEALISSYADSSDSSDSEESKRLPPPPVDLLNPINYSDHLNSGVASRVRSFPHVEGKYAVHVYIPVHLPSAPKKDLAQFLKRVTFTFPDLHVVDVDIPLQVLCKDDQQLEQIGLGREFHISLGRTVSIGAQQIQTMVDMLRGKLHSQKQYLFDFSKWEVFVNDEHTRTFLSLEVISRGLAEIRKQIGQVNEVYKRHNLPEFYKDPRPHISLAWVIGDASHLLKRKVEEELQTRGSVRKLNLTCKFSRIECKIGCKVYNICNLDE